MAHIVVLGTGGTISSRSGAAGSVATDDAFTLIGSAHEAEMANLEAFDILRKNSFNLTLSDIRHLADAIRDQLARPEVDGIVVTHGTDTVEETAFFVDLVHADPRPVVFTGAQLAADRPDSDGPANLRDAIALAADVRSRARGVLVAFAGRIYAARGLQKTDTLTHDPFTSREGGPIGRIVDGNVHLVASPLRPEALPMPGAAFDNAAVEIVPCYLGSGSAAFRRAVDGGARAIVLAGTGAGNLNVDLVSAVKNAVASGVVVALGTRVPNGPVVPIYGGGGGVDALAAGAVPLGTLSCAQARILIALLLERHDPPETAALLREYCTSS